MSKHQTEDVQQLIAYIDANAWMMVKKKDYEVRIYLRSLDEDYLNYLVERFGGEVWRDNPRQCWVWHIACRQAVRLLKEHRNLFRKKAEHVALIMELTETKLRKYRRKGRLKPMVVERRAEIIAALNKLNTKEQIDRLVPLPHEGGLHTYQDRMYSEQPASQEIFLKNHR